MRTTVTLDDQLLADATALSGIREKSALLNVTLREFIAGEASRRLAKLGGTMPGITAGPRKRHFDPE